MKVCIEGSTGTILCQTQALREGFAALGHQHTFELTHPDTAFVFVGNGPYDDYLNLARSRAKKTIFNVLDCPVWVKEWPKLRVKWAEQLQLCDRVTCISETVKRQLKEYCRVDAEVIYYPMKPVTYTGNKVYPYKVAMVGRLCDPEKFASTGIQSLVRAGLNENEVAMVGPEYPGWGTRMSTLSDTALNNLYNSVDYVFMLDRGCGIGLPAIEAACVGAIPIVAPHCMTFDEFWADSPLGLHYQQLNSPNDIAKLIHDIDANPTWKAEIKQDMMAYAALKFVPKFSREKVAARLVEVFQSI
jgi:glycosyltransferase involved in cell wall biosynthesis